LLTVGVKLLVLGANGQVGRALLRLAAERGVDHVGFGRGDVDIRDETELARAIDRDCIVVNCAAYTAVDRAESEPDLAQAVNCDAVAALARIAETRNLPLVHLSTDYVFDGSKGSAYVESDIVNPISAYGRSKAAGETAVLSLCRRHIILRTAWVYSATGHNFVRSMLRLAKQQAVLRVVSDQHGGPTSSDDIAQAILAVAAQCANPDFTEWGIYHFTGAPPTTWHGFASAILARHEGVSILPISTADYPTAARRPANSVLDCRKIRARFGIEQPDWRRSLACVLDRIQHDEGEG
jgi:dTDP-4-dehydrorhamnose reductase